MGAVMVIVLMGVAGVGKTTVGRRLARALGWRFEDGDDYHPPGNVEKMRRGIALTDADRMPWLENLRTLIAACLRNRESVVVACSALKQSYRDYLCLDANQVRFVYLKGDYALIYERLARRSGHFMKETLLASQFDALEEPQGVPSVDVAEDPDVIVGVILQSLGLRAGG